MTSPEYSPMINWAINIFWFLVLYFVYKVYCDYKRKHTRLLTPKEMDSIIKWQTKQLNDTSSMTEAEFQRWLKTGIR